jgi:glycosyltransferase involved in cell wall biosynthesis
MESNLNGNGNVLVIRHGVLEGFRRPIEPSHSDSEKFIVSHFATSSIERKGTLELIDGFEKFARGISGVELRLYIGPNDLMRVFNRAMNSDFRIGVSIRPNASPSIMAKLYCQSSVVCQPSMAEGFGLIPLEALCCGVPVVISACTGHLEYCLTQDKRSLPSVVLIEPMGMKEVEYDPGGIAFDITVDSIACALSEAYYRFLETKTNAMRLAVDMQETWSWKNTTEEYFDDLEEYNAHH